jgi:hypothetical protein
MPKPCAIVELGTPSCGKTLGDGVGGCEVKQEQHVEPGQNPLFYFVYMTKHAKTVLSKMQM